MLISALGLKIHAFIATVAHNPELKDDIEKLEGLFAKRNKDVIADTKFVLICYRLVDKIIKNTKSQARKGTLKQLTDTITIRKDLLRELRFLTTSIEHQVDVFIGLPEKDLDLFAVEKLTRSVGAFMSVMGFVYTTENEPVHGSFFQRLRFKTRFKKTGQELNDVYGKAKKALVAKFSGVPTAEATGIYAKSASELIQSLAPFGRAVIRTGGLLVAKTTVDGVPQLIVETISSELSQALDANPRFLQDPDLLITYINETKVAVVTELPDPLKI